MLEDRLLIQLNLKKYGKFEQKQVFMLITELVFNNRFCPPCYYNNQREQMYEQLIIRKTYIPNSSKKYFNI